jgi:type II secretory pathway pseudopilin PulG
MRRLANREHGFTIVEVLVAALVLVAGSFATFGLLRAAALNTQRAKGSQVALDRAQQELEALRSYSDKQLALTAAPAQSTNPLSPNYRVSGGTFAMRKSPQGDPATMVVNGGSLYGGGFIEGGLVNPGPTPFTSGDVSGKVYRYIVWRNDASCPEATCPGQQDYKQIVVAVRLDKTANQASEQAYVEVQSDFINPEDSALNDPIPGANGVVTAQQFFLSDTPCAASGTTSRAEISGSHPLRNTLGTCASGVQTGSTIGAPDALLLGSPPDPAPEDPTLPAEYDYSSDYPLQTAANAAKGIQLRRDDTTGCHPEPTGKSVPQWQVHRWVTDPMATDFMMSGQVTLDVWTRTVKDENTKGALCIFLFEREETGSPPKGKDLPLTNKVGGAAYWEYVYPGNGLWPEKWSELGVKMTFNGPITIKAGHRLGLGLGVNGNTSAHALSLMYDHPGYRSRIEVETPTPIDGG